MIVGTARDAADLLEPLFAEARGEKLAILLLDAERRLIAIDEHPLGSEQSVVLPMPEIIASALSSRAAGLIVAHNHPSGDPHPSAADIEATRRLFQTAAALGIRLHDHLIFAGPSCYSFRGLGLL
jgi:DNA repair protein RadC